MSEKKIKVLHILYELMPSGAEMMLRSAYSYWQDDCEMTILSTGPNIGVYATELQKAGYKVDHLPIQAGSKVGQESKLYKVKHIYDFYKYMKNHSFDVVHIHKESMSDMYAQISCKTDVKRIVRTVHNNFHFSGKLQEQKTKSRKKMKESYNTKFVAISDGVKQNEYDVFANECDATIYNWCDDSKYQYISNETKKQEKQETGLENKMTIVTTGNCYSVKNHELIIRALSKMKRKDKIHYFHIGYRAEETEKEMNLANNLGLGSHITFAGFTDPLPYMKKSDVYIMPSLYEGLSIAAIEALFTGMHLLLADTPGVVEFQNKDFDNTEYFHLDTENPIGESNINLLAEKLDILVDEWEKGKVTNSRKQYEQAKKIYSAEVGAEQYLKLYKGEA